MVSIQKSRPNLPTPEAMKLKNDDRFVVYASLGRIYNKAIK
jgi:hypothetical protein